MSVTLFLCFSEFRNLKEHVAALWQPATDKIYRYAKLHYLRTATARADDAGDCWVEGKNQRVVSFRPPSVREHLRSGCVQSRKPLADPFKQSRALAVGDPNAVRDDTPLDVAQNATAPRRVNLL